jgi:hypothetical protein
MIERESSMFAGLRFRVAVAAAVAFVALAAPASAQQPSASALATAKELVEIKGGNNMFEPVVTGIVEQTRAMLLQTSPQLAKDLTDVSAQLRTEFAPKRAELVAEAARNYAAQFSEQELKDAVAFFKSPLGKKILEREPGVLDQTFNFIQRWAPTVGEQVMVRFRAEMKKKGHDL